MKHDLKTGDRVAWRNSEAIYVGDVENGIMIEVYVKDREIPQRRGVKNARVALNRKQRYCVRVSEIKHLGDSQTVFDSHDAFDLDEFLKDGR